MKTNFFIVIIIVAAFSFGGCSTKKSFDLRVTVIPQTYNSAITHSDVNKAAEVINNRLINFFSIPQKRIKLDVAENKISMTVSNIDTGKIDLIKNVITDYGRLEFWETYENGEITGYLSKANDILNESQNPLFSVLRPMVSAEGKPLPSCMIGLANKKDTSEINRYLKMDQIKALFPNDIKFYWSANPYNHDISKSLYGLHAIKVTRGNKHAPLDGSVIISAKSVSGPTASDVKVDLTMDSAGAKAWSRITRENINRCIAVVYNGHVRSYPRVMNEISGGNTEITGDFTAEEANDFVNILRSGELPYELKISEAQIIKVK